MVVKYTVLLLTAQNQRTNRLNDYFRFLRVNKKGSKCYERKYCKQNGGCCKYHGNIDKTACEFSDKQILRLSGRP